MMIFIITQPFTFEKYGGIPFSLMGCINSYEIWLYVPPEFFFQYNAVNVQGSFRWATFILGHVTSVSGTNFHVAIPFFRIYYLLLLQNSQTGSLIIFSVLNE